jgi:hypothetical protein
MAMRSSRLVSGFHPSSVLIFVASPHSMETSAGRTNSALTLTHSRAGSPRVYSTSRRHNHRQNPGHAGSFPLGRQFGRRLSEAKELPMRKSLFTESRIVVLPVAGEVRWVLGRRAKAAKDKS